MYLLEISSIISACLIIYLIIKVHKIESKLKDTK